MMKKLTTLFLDIGGVLLTNGWDTASRKQACKTFKLDFQEMESRHHLSFDTFEIGKMSLKEYLSVIVFYEKRSFTPLDFQSFMFKQSKPYQETIDLLKAIKAKYRLKVIAVNNEAKELNEYRIKKFKLKSLIDFFASSCILHLKKPDLEIYHLSLEFAQADPKEVLYIDDRLLLVETAKKIGIQGLHHQDALTTTKMLALVGLKL